MQVDEALYDSRIELQRPNADNQDAHSCNKYLLNAPLTHAIDVSYTCFRRLPRLKRTLTSSKAGCMRVAAVMDAFRSASVTRGKTKGPADSANCDAASHFNR